MKNDNGLFKKAQRIALEKQRCAEERDRKSLRLVQWRRKWLANQRASNINIIKFPARHNQRVKGRQATHPDIVA